MFDKIKDLIAKYRAGDWKGAVKLILALIGDGIDMFTPSAEPTATAYSSMSADALVCELEKMNADPQAAAIGDRFKVFLPILMELLKKFLGV